MQTRSVAMQRGIVEVLTRVAAGLKQEARTALLTGAVRRGGLAAAPSACGDLAGLLAWPVRLTRRPRGRVDGGPPRTRLSLASSTTAARIICRPANSRTQAML